MNHWMEMAGCISGITASSAGFANEIPCYCLVNAAFCMLASLCSAFVHAEGQICQAKKRLQAADYHRPVLSALASRPDLGVPQRERGAKALEERMGKKAAAQATAQLSPQLPASTMAPDVETGIAPAPGTASHGEATDM